VPPVRHELIGRDEEQAALADFLEAAQAGPRVLLLEGEAGIGKTSLWKAALSSATGLGYCILNAAPTEAESALPYAVLGDLLDPVPEEALASIPIRLRSALEVALFHAPAQQGPTDQLAVSGALLRVLRQLATDQPVLVALDDIQWTDGPSMRVLTFAMHRLENERVRVLTTLRVPSVGEAVGQLRKAVGDALIQRLEVRSLPLNVIDDILLRRLARPLRRPELDHVYSASGGNPFFALEIGRSIVEHSTTLKAGEPLPLPASLADAIKVRLTTLSPATRDVLVAMASLSRPDEALLQAVDSRAMAALDEASITQVVERTAGRLRFTHPLLGSVIYSMADPVSRREWHSKLAEFVADPEEKARHLALAATSADAKVADALEEAARSANARGAPDAASSLAEQASALTPPGFPEAIERRRIMTAEFRMRAGDVPGARDVLRSVLDSPPTGKRPAQALRLMGTLTLGGEDLVEAERFLTEAVSQTGDDLPARAMVERDLITILLQRGKFPEAVEHSARLTELAKTFEDPAIVAAAQRFKMITQRHTGPLSPDDLGTAVAIAEDEISLPIDDAVGGLHPLMHWATMLKWSDDFPRARKLLKRALALTEGRDESLRAPILLHLAEMECWAGDWLLAAVYLDECEKSVVHSGHRSYARLSLSAKAMLACCRGEFDAAREAAQGALAISTAIGDEPYLRRALAILGATELAAGNPLAANTYLDRLRIRGNHQGFRGSVRSESDEVDALVAVDRLQDTEAVCARLAAFDDPWQRAIGARCRAILAAIHGDMAASLAEFERALIAHEELPMPLEKARTLLAYGTALRRAKQKRAARARLEEARVIFKSLGAPAWISRVESELSRIAPSAAGVGTLTPTETRVANLVSGGRTNKEVAGELFLSVKTVEANLSRIYDKLNVRSRSELAARLSRHG
jgi:DNA-binding CsgD family transcriptional regulator